MVTDFSTDFSGKCAACAASGTAVHHSVNKRLQGLMLGFLTRASTPRAGQLRLQFY